jgi:hypothetical protein
MAEPGSGQTHQITMTGRSRLNRQDAKNARTEFRRDFVLAVSVPFLMMLSSGRVLVRLL